VLAAFLTSGKKAISLVTLSGISIDSILSPDGREVLLQSDFAVWNIIRKRISKKDGPFYRPFNKENLNINCWICVQP